MQVNTSISWMITPRRLSNPDSRPLAGVRTALKYYYLNLDDWKIVPNVGFICDHRDPRIRSRSTPSWGRSRVIKPHSKRFERMVLGACLTSG
jgi:hypothetical protein